MTNFKRIKEQDDKYFLNTYAPFDIAFVSGEGSTLTDSEGKTYTDFLSGIAVNCLGYNNPIFTNAIAEQAKKLTVISNYFYSEERGVLAKLLVEGTNLNKVFFGSSGAEVVECALKLARKYFYNKGEKKFKIVSTLESFHGRTLGAVTLTGQPKYNLPFAPLPEGLGIYVPFNDIDALEKALSDPEVCAFLVEPVQGEGGVRPATKEYLRAARDITRKNGQLLILDEVQTGGGRTGKFWACEYFDVEPDILTAAKGIGGGFPIGACLATDEVAKAFYPGDHGTTFGASPLAMAVSAAVVKEIKKPNFMENVLRLGEHLKTGIKNINSPYVKEVLGKGLMIGADLDPAIQAKDVVQEMLEKGFVLNACGKNILRFIPPLIITEQEIDNMLLALAPILRG
ncbi:MAG: aspartate aminotransferase family protein [Clostridia bacterium]